MMNQKRPAFQLQLDELNEEAMGSIFFFFCVLTAYMGDVMNLNPFDQPGVEEGKVYIRENLQKQKELKLAAADNADNDVHRLRLGRE